MDLKQYLRVLRRRWWVIALCTVALVGVAAAAAWTQTPKYAAHEQLFVSTKSGGDATATYNGGLFAQGRVKSYADIVSSDVVVSAVRQQLGLTESVTDLQKKITASAPQDTVVVDVTVTDSDPARARDIAAAVGTQFTRLADQLETSPGSKLSAVKVTVVQPATLPTSPVSPDKSLYLALGLLIGLALGIGVVVLWAALDTTVASPDEAAGLAAAPVLASLPRDKKARDGSFLVTGDYFAPLADGFRRLRTNLRFLSSERARSLVVTSAEAGDGKTTVAVNLAITLVQGGESVVLIDADLRHPGVADILGISPGVGLAEVLTGQAEIDDVLEPWQGNPALCIISSGNLPPNPTELISSERMSDVLKDLSKRDVVVLIDSPALSPATDAAVLSNFADATILVVRPGKTRRDSLEAGVEALSQAGGNAVGVVMNRVPGSRPRTRARKSGPTPSVSGAPRTSPGMAFGKWATDEQ